MNLNVTQDNLYLYLPGKIAGVAAIIAASDGCTQLEAMRRFYASATYRGLQDETTKLWHLGAVALYELFKDNSADLYPAEPPSVR